VYAPEVVRLLAVVMRNTKAPRARQHDSHARDRCPRVRAFNACAARPGLVAVSIQRKGFKLSKSVLF
jgi:hypothetical protein